MVARIDIPADAKILVVDLAFIGDLLMSTPALACLRRAYPQARIDILVSPGSSPVIEHNPDVDNVLTTSMKKRGWKGIREEARRLSGENYHLALSLHRAHGTLIMLRQAGIPIRIGFTHGGRGFFLTGGVPFQIQRHRSWNHLRLIEKGLSIDVDYSTSTRLDLDPRAVDTLQELLDGHDLRNGLVAINPNAAWATKRWTPEGFACVADGLSEDGCAPILIGGPNEKQVAEQVKRSSKRQIIDFTGETSLQELAALLSRCRMLVTNDSGPMHMARAVNTPVLPIFGPTDPARCGPWLGEIEPLQNALDCIKCYRKTCWHMTCMRKLDGQTVLRKAQECLGNN